MVVTRDLLIWDLGRVLPGSQLMNGSTLDEQSFSGLILWGASDGQSRWLRQHEIPMICGHPNQLLDLFLVYPSSNNSRWVSMAMPLWFLRQHRRWCCDNTQTFIQVSQFLGPWFFDFINSTGTSELLPIQRLPLWWNFNWGKSQLSRVDQS